MTQASDDLRQQLLETAEAIAPGWERRRAFVEGVCAPVREWMLAALDPEPGQTVLELAAGAGDTGFAAVKRLGPGGRLLCTDLSPAMLDVARRRGAEVGVENVEYRQIDAERIELDGDSVDGVLCRFGYMLVGDSAAALAETRRVLRDGGRLALAVWGPPERNPFFALLGKALIERGHLPPPQPDGPGIFSLGNEEKLRGQLAAAGFGSIRIAAVEVAFEFPDLGEYLAIVADTAGPIALALREAGAGERAEIEAGLERAFAPFAGEAGYAVPGVALTAAAS